MTARSGVESYPRARKALVQAQARSGREHHRECSARWRLHAHFPVPTKGQSDRASAMFNHCITHGGTASAGLPETYLGLSLQGFEMKLVTRPAIVLVSVRHECSDSIASTMSDGPTRLFNAALSSSCEELLILAIEHDCRVYRNDVDSLSMKPCLIFQGIMAQADDGPYRPTLRGFDSRCVNLSSVQSILHISSRKVGPYDQIMRANSRHCGASG